MNQEIYYTDCGEPLRRGDNVSWFSMFPNRSGIDGRWTGKLIDMRLIPSVCVDVFGFDVELDIRSDDGRTVKLSRARQFNVGGDNHDDYFRKWLNTPCDGLRNTVFCEVSAESLI